MRTSAALSVPVVFLGEKKKAENRLPIESEPNYSNCRDTHGRTEGWNPQSLKETQRSNGENEKQVKLDLKEGRS